MAVNRSSESVTGTISGMPKSSRPLRLEIDPIIRNVQQICDTVARALPSHQGLARAAEGVMAAAREADRVSQKLKRPFGLHRLPATFLALALGLLVLWTYMRFFHTSTLSVALSERDAHELRDHLSGRDRVQFRPVSVTGSRQATELVNRGEVDLAFVQGGIAIPARLPRLESPSPELVLWFLRPNVLAPLQVKRILTSVADEGSHTVAQQFAVLWKIDKQVQYLHDWTRLADPTYEIPLDVDAVFVVKDPADNNTLAAVERLASADFRLATPDLGVRAEKLDFLSSVEIPAAHLISDPPFPSAPLRTYAVSTFLVARDGLTPRLLAVAGHLLDREPPRISDRSYELNVSDAAELFQGIEAFLGILVYIGVAFLALLGLEMLTYRRRFHELNSLISLISVHQSSKDVLGLKDDEERNHNLHYLSLCSDLLGLISMVAGYYTQENSSLLFSSLTEIIHQRCDGLKINIQLKILHAMIEISPTISPENAALVPEAPGHPVSELRDKAVS